MRPVFSRSCALALALLFLLAACGGGAKPFVFDEPFPEPDAGAGGGGGGGGTQLPPPVPPQAPLWDPNAASLGRTALFGSFASDLVLRGDTLFTVDADAVETSGARILAYDVAGGAPVPSTSFATTTILPADLRDSLGQPGNAAQPIGFGFFLNDLLVVDDHLAFVLVNAGGSDSAPTLSNVVAFDPTTGARLQTFDLATPYQGATPMADSAGQAVAGGLFVQSGAESMAYAGSDASHGRLYVAMSNLVFGAPSYGAVKLPGTIQVLEVALGSPTPLAAARGADLVPFVLETQGFNPVAIETVHVPVVGGGALHRLLVTIAGTTGYDAQYNLVPVTPSSVEAYDATSGALQGVFQLGFSGLSGIRPALGADGAGHRVGFYASSVTGEVYLLRLDGLYREPLDVTTIAVLRGPLNGIPITAAQAGGPGGNVTGVALSPDGRTLAVTGFGDLFAVPQVPGKLFLLSLPADLVDGSGFGADFVPGSTQFAATAGRTLAHVVVRPGGATRPDVFVGVSGTLDANGLGNGAASLGTLQTFGLIE